MLCGSHHWTLSLVSIPSSHENVASAATTLVFNAPLLCEQVVHVFERRSSARVRVNVRADLLGLNADASENVDSVQDARVSDAPPHGVLRKHGAADRVVVDCVVVRDPDLPLVRLGALDARIELSRKHNDSRQHVNIRGRTSQQSAQRRAHYSTRAGQPKRRELVPGRCPVLRCRATPACVHVYVLAYARNSSGTYWFRCECDWRPRRALRFATGVDVLITYTYTQRHATQSCVLVPSLL